MGTEAVSKSALQRELARKRYEVRMAEKKRLAIAAAREREQEGKRSTANSTGIWVPRKHWTKVDVMKSLEDKGKAKGRVAGGYIAGDLSGLRQTILLCPMCKHGFDWKKHHYYNVFHYDSIYATGRCDVCRMVSNKLAFYLHETYVADGTHHQDASWTPRARLREQRRLATLVG